MIFNISNYTQTLSTNYFSFYNTNNYAILPIATSFTVYVQNASNLFVFVQNLFLYPTT